MIDAFKTEGKFPSSFSDERHYFEGPIRCHYRPRRLWTLFIIIASSSVTLPMVFRAFASLFCSGIVNVMIGVSLLGSGNIFKSFSPALMLTVFPYSDFYFAQTNGP